MKNILTTFYLLLSTYYFSQAQYPTSFPADNAAFGKAYAEFIKSACTRDDCKELAEKFPKAIVNGKRLHRQCLLKKHQHFQYYLILQVCC